MLGGHFDLATTERDLDRLKGQMNDPAFWAHPEEAAKVSKQAVQLEKKLDIWKTLRQSVDEQEAFFLLAKEEGNDELEPHVEHELTSLEKRLDEREVMMLFSQPHDASNAIVTIYAGAGGTEAQDWAEMLMRMVLRFAERKGFTATLLSESRGEEAGIKSVLLRVEGEYAYGSLISESGVHRLVRLSPFNADQLRQTSFAMIEVIPELSDLEEVKLDLSEVRIDTYLASGKGGQGVNTTYSAVRVVHEPTGIMVTCQNERSQQQNRETALSILRARLFHLEEKKREAEREALRGERETAGWGHQIRSYVLHPYQMVKDHRTDVETADTRGVLDGDLDRFIEAYLHDRARVGDHGNSNL